MRGKYQFERGFNILVVWLLVGAGYCFPQKIPVESLNRVLIEDAQFSPVDLDAIKKGKLVTKILPTSDKREVAVFGITRIDAPIEVVEESFRNAIRKQEKKTTLQSGAFRDPPVYDDVANLKIEKKDLRALRICRITKCDVRLSALMIQRFSREIDWEQDGSESEAEVLYRRLLREYVANYLSRGDEALIEYESKRKTLSLRDEQRSLNQNLFLLKRFAPELASHLNNFPNSGVTNITDSVRWSKIRFGLKPVVIITHTATYSEYDTDTPQIIIVSKQIYSSRYIDSSLGLTAIMSFPKEGGSFETYIVFANHTRASALGSRLGSLARNLVEEEATGKLKNILADTRQGAASAIANRGEVSEIYQPTGIRNWFYQNANIIFLIFILVIAVIAVIAVNWHRRR